MGSHQYLFYQYASTQGFSQISVIAEAPSGSYPYAVKYDSNNTCYYMKVTLSTGTISEAACNLGWTANYGQFLAEVLAQQDYVPGTYANPAETYSEQYMRGGTWYTYGAYPNETMAKINDTEYGAFKTDGYDYHKIYDTRT